MSERSYRSDAWADVDDARDAEVGRPLTREQARALREKDPPVSPWRVVAVQIATGAVVAALAVLVTGRAEAGWSALYGAAVVVKIAVSVAMLMLAPQIVQPLSWPALLVALVVCIKVYWVALLWRRR
ncbi:MAG: ATP synthase subunit I [Burkholderiaceae bacterium]|nr:ATP synthase subunit I [Burkholderiaceae bacterium]